MSNITLRHQLKSESEVLLTLLMYREIESNEIIQAIKDCPNQSARIVWLRYNRILNLKAGDPGYSIYLKLFKTLGNIKAGGADV